LPVLNEDYKLNYHIGNPLKNGIEACLSLNISDASFMFSVSQPDFTTIIEIGSINFKSKVKSNTELIEKLDFLIHYFSLVKNKYSRVRISILNNDFVLIPKAYSTENTTKQLLNFISHSGDSDKVKDFELKNLKFCFSVNSELIHFLEKLFPNLILLHNGINAINSLFEHHAVKHNNLFLIAHHQHIEICAKNNQELLFYNIFSYLQSEDILYYLLFLLEQFKLNPLHTRLSIAGELEADSTIIKEVKKYIRHVELCSLHPQLKLMGELEKIPQHFFHTLLHQHLCE
jgi:hypothetical protein